MTKKLNKNAQQETHNFMLSLSKVVKSTKSLRLTFLEFVINVNKPPSSNFLKKIF